MTSAQVAETSVTNNSSFLKYPHPDDHTIQTDGHNVAKFNGTPYIPEAPAPYTLAGRSSLSALPNLAAETIFIDLVIFWIFFTLLSRKETKNKNTCSMIVQFQKISILPNRRD